LRLILRRQPQPFEPEILGESSMEAEGSPPSPLKLKLKILREYFKISGHQQRCPGFFPGPSSYPSSAGGR
jgi:hypothetical protein